MIDLSPNFVHRLTIENIYESICLKCYATVGKENDEKELVKAEAKHVCNVHKATDGQQNHI